jgi:hypothetical protein
MNKTLLECAEKTLSVSLSVSSTMGFTLFGWFFLKLVLPSVTENQIWICFLISVALTYGCTKLLTLVKWRLYNMLVEELELQEDEQAQALCEHLGVK